MLINTNINRVGRVLDNDPEDQGLIPGQVQPKTQKDGASGAIQGKE